MSSRPVDVARLIASLGKGVRGSHLARLDGSARKYLDGLFTYLVKVEGKGEATARVYKSLCAKALVQGADPTNKVMMSALRALVRFDNTR